MLQRTSASEQWCLPLLLRDENVPLQGLRASNFTANKWRNKGLYNNRFVRLEDSRLQHTASCHSLGAAPWQRAADKCI